MKDKETENLHSSAKKIFAFLENTMVADINSLMYWARDFDDAKKSDPSLGGLNFTLALASLTACETCGFYLSGADQHTKSNSCNNVPDLGSYIMSFISAYFPTRSLFKKIDKILADFLRHALVHGYGSYNPYKSYDISLFIDSNLSNKLSIKNQDSMTILKLNSLSLADHTIKAFNSLKSKIDKGDCTLLLKKIIAAKNLQLPTSSKVENQFKVIDCYIKRHGI